MEENGRTNHVLNAVGWFLTMLVMFVLTICGGIFALALAKGNTVLAIVAAVGVIMSMASALLSRSIYGWTLYDKGRRDATSGAVETDPHPQQRR